MRWNTLGLLLSNNIARVIYVLPAAGYVILYSDYFQSLFHFTSLSRSSWGFMTFNERINFIYFGSWLLLIAFGLYWWLCPRFLRGKRDLHHFASDIIVSRDRGTVQAIVRSQPLSPDKLTHSTRNSDATTVRAIVGSRGADLGSGAGEYEDAIPRVLSFYYHDQNVTLPRIRAIISVIALAGYLLVLILPSLDLLLRVLGTHYHQWFG